MNPNPILEQNDEREAWLDLLQRWVDSHDAGAPAGQIMAADLCVETRQLLQQEADR